MAGTETFKVIKYKDIPQDRRKEVCHTKVVCEVLPHKEDPDRTRITIGGNRIIYPGDVVTPTASLELIKLILNSVLSRPGAKFACFDVKKNSTSLPPWTAQSMRASRSKILLKSSSRNSNYSPWSTMDGFISR